MARTSGAKARTPAGGKRRTPRAPSPLPDELEDEVDRFHRQREQVALQAPHPSRLDALGGSEDELDEEEVMALAGSSEEELDTDEEEERETRYGQRACGGGVHMHRGCEGGVAPCRRARAARCMRAGAVAAAAAAASAAGAGRQPSTPSTFLPACGAVAKQAKKLEARLRIQQGEGEEGEEEDEAGEEGGGAAWGRSKRAYYGADLRDLEVRLAPY